MNGNPELLKLITVDDRIRNRTMQEKKPKTENSPMGAGFVKLLVPEVDETGEPVANATILTMVKKLNQDSTV